MNSLVFCNWKEVCGCRTLRIRRHACHRNCRPGLGVGRLPCIVFLSSSLTIVQVFYCFSRRRSQKIVRTLWPDPLEWMSWLAPERRPSPTLPNLVALSKTVITRNHWSSSYRYRDRQPFRSNIAKFPHCRLFNSLWRGFTLEFCNSMG